MKVRFLKKMIVASGIGLLSVLATSEPANAQWRGTERGRQPQRQIEQQRQQQTAIWQRQQAQQRLVLQRQQQQLALQRQQQLALQRQQELIRLERLRQEQIRLQNARNRNRAVTNRGYRVYRNGGYYQTDRNGVTILQQAVNYGYQQGVREGQSDRANGRRFNYQASAGFRSANYGYSYVDSSEYQYYFREGFRRGYEDGYNSRSQYGSNSNGRLNILAAILQQVLNFQAF